jgi:hypothetical protein
MRNSYLIFVLAVCFMQHNLAQENSIVYDKGTGMEISANNGDYLFKIGGFIQPAVKSVSDGVLSFDDTKSEQIYKSKASVFMLSGTMKNEKLRFMIMTDFSLDTPMQEAWVAYDFSKNASITFGQMLSFTNNREMMYRENNLQMNDRSALSQSFSNSGREFGVFVQTHFDSPIGAFAPMVALTSGDGKNSFGNDSRDVDKGKYKFGGRIDYYPFGSFSAGNQNTSSDIVKENKLKWVLGAAGSINNGASNEVGEGHGDFILYDGNGLESFPNYNKLYFDSLMKFNGFSLLFEYVNSWADSLDEIYTSNGANGLNNADLILLPTQISNYMVLGNQYNFQLGYLTNSGVSIDVRFGESTPEFEANQNSILAANKIFAAGLTKYFSKNIKFQLLYDNTKYDSGISTTSAEVLMQIVF